MVWEVFADDQGHWFWRLRGPDNKVILISRAHDTEKECFAEIDLVRSASGAYVQRRP